MPTFRCDYRCLFVVLTVLVAVASPAFAQLDRFIPAQGGDVEVWRITDDPAVRDHINYHNRQAWSPDGRYLALLKYDRPGARGRSHIRLFDLHTKQFRLVGEGNGPRWANRHNWLFYTRRRPENGPAWGTGTEVMWLDVDTGTLTRIGFGIGDMKFTDHLDRWLYGIQMLEGNRHVRGQGLNTHGRGVRLPIREDARLEALEWDGGYGYGSLYVNPGHPMILSRDHDFWQFPYGTPGERDVPFVARMHVDYDLEGRHATRPFPLMEGSHFSWSGDGEWFLCGNGVMRGRRWDEPLPANIHFLATMRAGDISPCSRSGRWICGSGNWGPMPVADLRSGEAVPALRWAMSYLHDSRNYGYSHGSALHDNDAKGSADGTKLVFVSNYDLKNGPVTEVTGPVSGDRIPVRSTAGFPPSGRLSVYNEVVGYDGRTADAFTGITRGLYNTETVSMGRGTTVSSFEARLIPEATRRTLSLAPEFQRADFPEPESPLMWQAQTDVFVAVVRQPDPPFLREFEGATELVPGENHYETCGYHIYRDGRRLTDTAVAPGTTFRLPGAGSYTAVAVEWSGLESAQSPALRVSGAVDLYLHAEKPADFSWTSDRRLAVGREVTAEDAADAADAVREIVHRLDGVIHREWYSFGVITRRFDLNPAGRPIRRLFYADGLLARREYHTADGEHVSTELFDGDGYITESIEYRRGEERSHWWYEQAEPVRNARRTGDGYVIYERSGERWELREEIRALRDSRLLQK